MVDVQATVIEVSGHAIDAVAEATLDLKVEVEELDDGSDCRYMATSPDLPNLTVVGETPEEVLALVPQVAAALIASMKAVGDALPETLRGISSLPFVSRVAVPV